jgi:hypothetical protein
MTKIHSYLHDIKKYIEYTENNANNFLTQSSNLDTFSQFNQNLKENIIILKQFKEKIERIGEYKFSIKKVMKF